MSSKLKVFYAYCGAGLVTKLRPTLASPWTVALQSRLSMGFPRQEYWNGFMLMVKTNRDAACSTSYDNIRRGRRRSKEKNCFLEKK